VDNVGTVNLVDAAKQAGVSKFVLVSSILTNGRGWGQVSEAVTTVCELRLLK
jgi:nucleoside-diphosphate-sugar epimerase